MSVGIRAWDEAGNLILDLTDRLTKLVASGSGNFPTPDSVLTVPVAGMTDDGSWVVIASNQCYVYYGNGSFQLRASRTFYYPGMPVSYSVLRR